MSLKHQAKCKVKLSKSDETEFLYNVIQVYGTVTDAFPDPKTGSYNVTIIKHTDSNDPRRMSADKIKARLKSYHMVEDADVEVLEPVLV